MSENGNAVIIDSSEIGLILFREEFLFNNYVVYYNGNQYVSKMDTDSVGEDEIDRMISLGSLELIPYWETPSADVPSSGNVFDKCQVYYNETDNFLVLRKMNGLASENYVKLTLYHGND